MFIYLQILVGILMIFMLFFMRGGLENPIYSLLKLGHTKFNEIIMKQVKAEYIEDLELYLIFDIFYLFA